MYHWQWLIWTVWFVTFCTFLFAQMCSFVCVYENVSGFPLYFCSRISLFSIHFSIIFFYPFLLNNLPLVYFLANMYNFNILFHDCNIHWCRYNNVVSHSSSVDIEDVSSFFFFHYKQCWHFYSCRINPPKWVSWVKGDLYF